VHINLEPGESEHDGDLGAFSDINITPFVDVMLVLLIIFMVTAPLMMAGVPVKLPATSATKENPPPNPLVVTIAEDASLYVRNEQVSREGLTRKLADIHAAEGDVIAYVRADKVIAYGDVMAILGEIGKAGFTHISLLTQAKSQSSPR
jgi:biopolymer transport protein ExbD